jgi:Zn-dependent M28 family amino/carboxypeptidase
VRWIAVIPLLAGAVLAPAQDKFQFFPVDREVVLKRVQVVPQKNESRAEGIKDLFAEAGCADSVSEQKLTHSKYSNIICRLPGETDETIIVGAHYDKVTDGTGAIDNWTGAALLSSLYESLAKQTKRHHTFLFVAFCEEETGLAGSEFYVSRMTKDDVAKTKAMVNMDTLGLSSTKIWVHRADKSLVQALLTVASAIKLPASEVDVERMGTTDSESFAITHIPRITIHSVMQDNFSILHTQRDTLKELRPDDYYDTYRLMSGYLVYLDQLLQPRPGKK